VSPSFCEPFTSFSLRRLPRLLSGAAYRVSGASTSSCFLSHEFSQLFLSQWLVIKVRNQTLWANVNLCGSSSRTSARNAGDCYLRYRQSFSPHLENEQSMYRLARGPENDLYKRVTLESPFHLSTKLIIPSSPQRFAAGYERVRFAPGSESTLLLDEDIHWCLFWLRIQCRSATTYSHDTLRR
jgi:hypothetical protein